MARAQTWAWFQDRNTWGGTTAGSRLWERYRTEVLEHWAKTYPGRRPAGFWKFEASAPRLRLGGIGEPWGACQMARGVPLVWNHGDHRDLWHNPPTPIDVNFPPLFEAEAAYLKRLRLFLPGEERRLKPADFAPESVLDIIGLAP